MTTNDNQHTALHGIERRRPPRRKVVDLSFEQHTSIGEWVYKSALSIIVVVLILVLFLVALLIVHFDVERHEPLIFVEVEMALDEESPEQSYEESPEQSFEELPDMRNQVQTDVRNLQSNASATESGGQKSIFDDAEISSMMKQVEGYTSYSVEDTGGTGDSSTPGSGGWGQGSGYGEGSGVGDGKGKGDNKFAGRVTVSYKFDNPVRDARGRLYAPAYRAEYSGTVVVAVVLDRNGEVKSAKIAKSSGVKALDNEALRAANHRLTIFNIDSSAPRDHRGTITYEFIAQ